MSYADEVFIKNCRDILDKGVWDTDQAVRPRWEDGTPAHTIKLFGVVNRYDLSKEFPILTIRKQYLKNAVDELLWIWQKNSNNIHDLNSHVWDAWADEKGSIGKAYGYQMGKSYRHHKIGHTELLDQKQYPSMFLDHNGWVYLSQTDGVLWDLKHNPSSRRILTSIFNPTDLADMALQPCAWSTTFNVASGKLNMVLNQRSQDMLTANGWNVMQYAVLLYMIAQVTGFEPGELVHVIADCHIYDRHVSMVEEIISREPLPAPGFFLEPGVKNFYEFTKDDVHLVNYEACPFDKHIPVAI